MTAAPSRAARRVLLLEKAVAHATTAHDRLTENLQAGEPAPRAVRKSRRRLDQLVRRLGGMATRTTPAAIEVARREDAAHTALIARERQVAAARVVKQRAASRAASREREHRARRPMAAAAPGVSAGPG